LGERRVVVQIYLGGVEILSGVAKYFGGSNPLHPPANLSIATSWGIIQY
jgi:hypothetical protein